MVTGIVLPEGSSKLYSASKDGTVRVWDCHTGHCGSVINLGGQAGSLFSKGPWVFAGAPNVVKVLTFLSNCLVIIVTYFLCGLVGLIIS